MGKHPPEKYEPGELEKTRKNLGLISDDEAREIADKLGGEVGVEKMPDEISDRYTRLREINRRKSDRLILPSPHLNEEPSFAAHTPLEPSLKKVQRKGLGYLERMRINFLLANPDYRIKTQLNAYLSLFSFAIPVKDTISRDFVLHGDSAFYKAIENLVLSVRGLLAINREEHIRSIRHPGYLQVLETIKAWELEVISRELGRLQRNPGALCITEARRLTKAVFRPLVILGNLDIHNHILKAIKHATDLDMLGMPKNSPEIGRIKRLYSTARQESFTVFTEVKKGLYPLLLRLSDSHFHEFEDFFTNSLYSIYRFLSVTEENLIEPFDDTYFLQQPDDEDEDEAAGLIEEEDGQDIQVRPVSVENGLLFLDALFPEAGFLSLELFPDLFSYFRPVLSFPGGLDIINPRNPVHQVMILAAIIQEMFYGFRSVKFGEIRRDEGRYENVQPSIDHIISEWHRFSDEVIHQNYVSTLVDYCHQVEMNPGIKYADYGGKMEAMLQFFVRKYIFPSYHMYTLKGTKSPFPEKLYRIYSETARLKTLLEEVLNHDLAGEMPPSLKNASADMTFEIGNHVSKRLQKFLKKRQQHASNRNLVKYTLLVVSVLDYLLNDESNYIYRNRAIEHYRHEEGREDIPLYSILPRDTESILLNSEIGLVPPETLIAPDEAKKQLNEKTAKKLLKGHIDRLVNEDVPLSVLGVSFMTSAEEGSVEVYHIIETTIREYMDILVPEGDNTFLLVLPETGEDEAKSLFSRIATKFADYDETGTIHGCITPCMKSWGPEKLLKLSRQGLEQSRTMEGRTLLQYDPREHIFQ